jgi:hypothetical protein
VKHFSDHPGGLFVVFVDDDGYEFATAVRDTVDKAAALERAWSTARTRVADGDWRPFGGLMLDRITVEQTTAEPEDSSARPTAWRRTAATRLQAAIGQLESAAAGMPVSRERALTNRALRIAARTFRECTRAPLITPPHIPG